MHTGDTINEDEEAVRVSTSLKNLVQFYSDALNSDISDEWMQWKLFISQLAQFQTTTTSPTEMLGVMIKHRMQATFPNIFNALRIYLTLPVSNCTGERSFSHLKRLKNAWRSTTGQERLNCLAVMNMETDIVRSLDFADIVETFASSKARRKDI
jgi:hypothetical protein